MLPQTAVRIIGVALILQGLVFYAFATPLTAIFHGSDEATHVGVIMRRGLAAMSFLADAYFLVRNEGYRTQTRFVRLHTGLLLSACH